LCPDGSIVTAHGSGLVRIPANGGPAETLTTAADGTSHLNPSCSPDGDALLFQIFHVGEGQSLKERIETSEIAVISLETGETKVLMVEGGIYPRVTVSGHLLIKRGATLWATVFDAASNRVIGDVVPVLDGLGGSDLAGYDLSQDGTLVHLVSEGSDGLSALVLVDRFGVEETLAAPPRNYRFPAMSPDGDRIAVGIGNLLDDDIWIYSLVRGTSMRLTFVKGANMPSWTPDGREIRYMSGGDLRSQAADGTGVPRQLTNGPKGEFTSQHGALSQCVSNAQNCDIGILSPDRETGVELIVASEYNEMFPAISPDGRWLAYMGDESGRYEIYLRPYPNVDDGKWVISSNGGGFPRWSPDSHELYYLDYLGATSRMMAISIEGDNYGHLEPGTAITLFDWPAQRRDPFDTTPDGQRFLFARPINESQARAQIAIVENLFDELERLLPTK